MKRGQVSFFIIIGLIVLIAFVFLYYLSSNLEVSVEDGSSEIAVTRLQGEPVRVYVESCIRSSFENLVPLFLSQGGRIYSDQDASILPCDSSSCTAPGFIEFSDYEVSYLLSSNVIGDDLGNRLLDAPAYPCNSTSCEFKFDFDRECAYDSSQFCPLPLEPPLYRARLLSFTEGSYSWEKQLADKLEFEINDCIAFNESEWYPFEVLEGSSSAEFIFADETTNLNVEVPLTLSHPKLEPQLLVQDYSLSFEYPLRSLYDFTKSLVYSESVFLNFDLENNFSSLPQYKPSFNVEVLKDYSLKDDVVKVLDSKSGLELDFARENIPPVLDYYDSSSHPVFHVEAPVEFLLRLSPRAYDPNEDELVYLYGGWMQDYDDRALPDGSFQQIPVSVGSRWMDSSLYRDTLKDAEIYLNFSDAGTHEVIINVTDGEKFDYQVLKIHVTVPGVSS